MPRVALPPERCFARGMQRTPKDRSARSVDSWQAKRTQEGHDAVGAGTARQRTHNQELEAHKRYGWAGHIVVAPQTCGE